MIYLQAFHLRKALLLCLVPMVFPACAALKDTFSKEQDAKIAGLQRETRRVSRSNAATQNALKDLYRRTESLQARLNELDQQVQEIADREPILITPDGPEPALRRREADTPSAAPREPSAETKERPPSPEPPPKKRADLVKTAPQKQDVIPEANTPTPTDDYDTAYAAYEDGRYDEALALFKAFLTRYPTHDLSDNAHYWIGEIYYDIDNFPEAILAFKEVATRFPQANKAPHALLKIGYAYMALDDPDNARTFFKRVIKNYPFSDAETMARAKLKELENVR